MSLQQFYNAYAAWLDAGAPDGQPFTRHTGLCINLYDWSDCDDQLTWELENHFNEGQLDVNYPFNEDGEDYRMETQRDECHLNPKRIQWVTYHAK